MITFNNETIEKLKKYENYFNTVLDLQYIRATSKDMDAIKDIYVEAGGKVVGYSNGCYQCRYNLVKQVGLAYRASVKNVSNETKVTTDETKILKETDAKANTTHTSKSKGNTRKSTRKQSSSK